MHLGDGNKAIEASRRRKTVQKGRRAERAVVGKTHHQIS